MTRPPSARRRRSTSSSPSGLFTRCRMPKQKIRSKASPRQERNPVTVVAGNARRVDATSVEGEGVEPERDLLQRSSRGLRGGHYRQQVGDLALGPGGLRTPVFID